MYSELPYFVFGFHGCDEAVKEAVLHGKQEMVISNNPYDWLGTGMYFWEQNAARAMDFAISAKENPKLTAGKIVKPAVLGAIINLGNCLNLMDTRHILELEQAYRAVEHAYHSIGEAIPYNKGGLDNPLRMLDREVIEMLHTLTRRAGEPPHDTVRALFTEGVPVYPGAGFMSSTHIQLCVRNRNCIKAFFDPRERSNSPFSLVSEAIE